MEILIFINLERNKMKTRNYKFTSNQVKKIIKLYKKENTCKEIALKMKSNIITIIQYLERNGIKRRKSPILKTRKKIRETLLKKKTKSQVFKAILSGAVRHWRRYKTFRHKILKRDKYKCQICRKKGKGIHHKKEARLYPELFFSFSNVITICQSCYSKIHRVATVKMYKNKIVKLEKLVRKYKSISLIDDLTKTYNHRKLYQDIKRYLEIQKRHKINFTVLLLDIDNFKKYNDNYGHKVGDKILKKVVYILKKSIRKYEKIYRNYNGDEFVVIFSHTNNITKAVKRIKKNLVKEDIEISIGKNKLCKNILEIIDRKMYEEKRRK